MGLLGNQFMNPVMQSVDMLLGDVEKKKNIAREDQMLSERRDREDMIRNENRKYGLMGNLLNNRDLTDEFRADVGQNMLQMIGKGQYFPEFKPQAAEETEQLYALPENPNDPFYEQFGMLREYAGEKMWTADQLAGINQKHAKQKEDGRHNKANEWIDRLKLKNSNSSKSGGKGSQKDANQLRKVQLKQMESMERILQQSKSKNDFLNKNDTEILRKITKNKVRLMQEGQSPFKPEEFQKFVEDPLNYIFPGERVTPEKVYASPNNIPGTGQQAPTNQGLLPDSLKGNKKRLEPGQDPLELRYLLK